MKTEPESEIIAALTRIETRQEDFVRRVEKVEQEVEGLSKFRWLILGGMGAAGTAGGALGAELASKLFQ